MTATTANFTNENGASPPLKAIVGQYLRYWYVFVLSGALALFGAYWYLQYATPIYQVNAVLLLKDKPKNLSDDILNQSGAAQQTRSIENEIELLKSSSLLLRAVNDPQLTVSYFTKSQLGNDHELYVNSPVTVLADTLTPAAYTGSTYIHVLNSRQFDWQNAEHTSLGTFSFGQCLTTQAGTFRVRLNPAMPLPDDKTVSVQFVSPESVAGRYKASLRVALLNQNSTMLKLTLEDALPPRGEAVLGRILTEYHRSKLAEKDHEVATTLHFIDDRLRLISGELQNVEQDIESYRKAENITDLSAEGTLFLNGVNANDKKINEVEVQLNVLNGVSNFLKNNENGTAPASLSDPLLLESLRKLADLRGQQEKYARSMQPANPFLKGLGTQIATIETAIQENVANQRQNLQIIRRNLQQQNNRYTSAIRTIPQKERQFINIKRQQGIKESLYLLLLQKKEEAALTYASSLTDSQVIDAPSSAGYPLRPNPKNIYLVALLAGLLLPVGGIMLRNLLNSKVNSRKDIEATAGLAVFGEIMRKPKGLKDTIIDVSNNRTIAEQFKVLRANLPFIDNPGPSSGGQVLLVTSSTVGEGKSFFSSNMAFNLAQLNKRVVILELDLRNPKTTQYLGMTNGQQTGLSDYLNGYATVDDILRPTPLSPALFLISSGPLPPNPSELLSNGNLVTLLTDLRQRFDYIVLDTPPVAFVADTIIMAPHADLSFYLVRQSYTPRNYMQLLSGLEANNKFKSLHVIFNGVESSPAKDAEYGYGYTHTKTR